MESLFIDFSLERPFQLHPGMGFPIERCGPIHAVKKTKLCQQVLSEPFWGLSSLVGKSRKKPEEDFLKYLDQFGKTKVHLQGCVFFGQPEPAGPCTCPLKQAWGSLDALIGRLRAAYEENGGLPDKNPFASGAIRVYLREVRDSQAKARGIPYKKKKKKRNILKPNDRETSNYHHQQQQPS
ncbi:hypothetical protein M9H77_21709 [Catharanthus roseus]|uniref:Uncharacterized protein n=1 Tax=Catharanthus roseus TaxID=4058 RepID=A0ACC0ASE6_CATRO|nr:hypothetical protein M9H77_21709 [Catharanthus roseus]